MLLGILSTAVVVYWAMTAIAADTFVTTHRPTMEDGPCNMRKTVKCRFDKGDFWVGCYIDFTKRAAYWAPLPFVVVKVYWEYDKYAAMTNGAEVVTSHLHSYRYKSDPEHAYEVAKKQACNGRTHVFWAECVQCGQTLDRSSRRCGHACPVFNGRRPPE